MGISLVRRMAWLLGVWLVLIDAGPAAAAAKVELRTERGPHYVGEPIELHLQVTGLERNPEPTCLAEAPNDTTLTLAAVVPTVSSSVQILNGQVTRTETVTFTCQYVLTASRPGSYRLGPFDVEQGATVVRSGARTLLVKDVPLDPRLRIRVLPEAKEVFVGQQIPVRIEWWLDASLEQSLRRYSIRSPLFNDPEAFRFQNDTIALRGQQSLEIHTTEGELALAAEVQRRTQGGRQYLVVVAERIMIPLRQGRFELEPATVNVEEVTRWQRDLFGSRRPASSQRLFARGEALTLDVRPTPTAGRPESFGGAIGKGFALDVTTDRSVVQAGDPITLTLAVRGEGILTTVGPPRLDGPGGLPADSFRVPEDDLTGEVEDGVKRFEVVVRVLDEAVREIPAIEYAWFDPELGEYQTTTSRPIALSVKPAQVVSADDVVVARPDGLDFAGTNEEGGSPAPARALSAGSRALIGADLSIEQRVDRLTRRRAPARAIQAAFYGGGVAMVIGALIWRRRGQTSPHLLRLRALHREQRARIEAAAGQSPREALTEIANALRELRSETDVANPDLDVLVRECDEILYAPTEPSAADVHERLARAREIARAIGEEVA